MTEKFYVLGQDRDYANDKLLVYGNVHEFEQNAMQAAKNVLRLQRTPHVFVVKVITKMQLSTEVITDV